MLRPWWLILTCAWFCPVSAWAVDPTTRISQYAHAAWRIQDGLFRGSPIAIVQTQDGYLWLGTTSGLLRFDGVRFVPWSSEHGERLASSQIQFLLAARDGSLWVATGGGLSRWKDRTLTNYRTGVGVGGVGPLVEDHEGNVWVAQPSPANGTPGSGPLCRALEAELQCFGLADGVPVLKGPNSLSEDAQGNLWIGDSVGLFRWSKGSHSAYQTSGLKNNPSGMGVMGLVSTPDDTLWVGIAKAGPGLGLQQLVQGRWRPFKTPELDGSTLAVLALHLDRQGSLWIGTADRGIYRIHDNNVDHFDTTNGLSSDYIVGFAEDHEGSLWVTTTRGVDRFSDTSVISFSSNEGLCSTEAVSIVAARDGAIWVGGDSGLSHLQDGRVSCLRTGKELPGTQVTSLMEDHAGRLWIGLDDALWIYEHGTFRRIIKPDGSQIGFVSGMAEDSEHSVWVAVSGPPRLLMRIQEMTVRDEYHEPQMPRRVAAVPSGGIWLGLVNGDLAFYHKGKLETYRFAHDDAALLHQLLPGADGSVLAATTFGLIGWHEGKRLNLSATNGLPCDAVNAITLDAEGNLWLFMDCALGVMTRTDLQMWKHNPDTRVSIRTFDEFDGVRTGWAAFQAGATSSDGQVWFVNASSLQVIDPAHLRRNPIPPPVHIEQVVADRKSFPAGSVVHLPPLTRDLEIDYVGLSFVAPQKVLFRYRLEGRDDTWQEPGTRRQAFYSDLPPGRYRFRVTASNNHGLWNEHGATFDIVIAPAWYQTIGFLLLCVVTSAVVMWALYQLRIRQVARALNARFDERLGERIRVARDLHDTLLQTVQGSKMVADDALDRPADAIAMRHAMEQLSMWLGHASTEGRAAVNTLRASMKETNDLAEAFRRAIEDCRRQGSLQASLSVTGDPRETHPVVRDEVYRIGYEAIRNACRHSGGTRLEVGLSYAADLIVRVSDNGVGIDPVFASEGREGHFGLQGMRERAARIGATLTVESPASVGTEILVIVPGRLIFRERPGRLFDRITAHSRATAHRAMLHLSKIRGRKV